VLPIKDNIPQERLPVVTLALIAIGAIASVVLQRAGTIGLGELAYLLANLLFLWIFGPGVEDSTGRARFLAFVVLGVAAATLAHVLADSSSSLAMVVAPGAIATVAGAYLLLFPRRKVLSAVFVIFFFGVVETPALVVLGLWLALQVAAGLDGLVAVAGGFAAGLLLAKPLLGRRRDERGLEPRIPAY
jgi:membrane associated rhomboid family serine protease